MCTDALWQRLWPALPSSWKLVHVPVPDDLSQQALLSSLLNVLPPHPVNLVGFSMGGYLAAALTRLAPERVARLMVLSNTPCRLPDPERQQRQQILAWLEKLGYKGIQSAKIQQMLGSKQRQNEWIHNVIKGMDAQLGANVLVQQLRATTDREDLSGFYSATRVPTAFCYGAEDLLVSPAWFEQVANNICVHHFCVPDAGHMLPLEAPEIVAEQIRIWFNLDLAR